uniref:MULE transposase domain-containing protein n=1 Tax=Romanomermis culicivorax TaxID=13658 RepID=A0A915JMI7_ROMCU
MRQSEYWIADGTFEMRPPIFSQIYTLHGFINGESFIYCYALMPDKTRATYEILFRAISQAIIEHHGDLGSVHTILLDFEAADYNAARAVFNNIATKGCLLHFGQCLIRQVQRNGLMQQYDDRESVFHKWIKLLKTLAFLPLDLVIQSYDAWLQNLPKVDDAELQERINNFNHYFQSTYWDSRHSGTADILGWSTYWDGRQTGTVVILGWSTYWDGRHCGIQSPFQKHWINILCHFRGVNGMSICKVYQFLGQWKIQGKGLQHEWLNVIFGQVVLCLACQTYNILSNITIFTWIVSYALQQSPNEVVDRSVQRGCDEDFGVVNRESTSDNCCGSRRFSCPW